MRLINVLAAATTAPSISSDRPQESADIPLGKNDELEGGRSIFATLSELPVDP